MFFRQSGFDYQGETLIQVVDYGMGNIGSVLNMIRKVGGTATATSDPREIETARKLLLPGIGSFDTALQRLEELGLTSIVRSHAMNGKLLLGICLGMQLLADTSEEGTHHGLSLIPGKVQRFSFGPNANGLKIPHMGWNHTRICRPHRLVDGLDAHSRFYFVHSYHFECAEQSDILLRTEHGYEFASAIQRGNVMGVQFHPEKSHRFGMQLLKNFVEM